MKLRITTLLLSVGLAFSAESYGVTIDKTPLSGMPWDLIEIHPNEIYMGKTAKDVVEFDHVLVMQASQSGKTENDLVLMARDLVAKHAITDAPRHKIVVKSGYHSFTLWLGNGIVGYIHVINGNEYVLTVLKDHGPKNYYYK